MESSIYEEAAREKYKINKDKDFYTPLNWIKIDIQSLSSKGRFYSPTARILIRAAESAEIEHYSTMIDDNPIDINNHYRDILARCCQFKDGEHTLSYKDLCEMDKMDIILLIKELTFVNPENKLVLKENCKHCGHSNDIEINTKNLSRTSFADPILEKYYSEEERCYVIQTKKYGEFRLKPPTIGIMAFIFDWGVYATQNKKKLNKALFQVLGYLNLDWRDARIIRKKSGEQEIDASFDILTEWEMWDSGKKSLIFRLCEMMKMGIDQDIKVKCSNCGEEVVTPFRFPNSPKDIFIISDITNELV
jgi:rRNA maturation protein Nop10